MRLPTRQDGVENRDKVYKTTIEFGFRIIWRIIYGDLEGCYPPQPPSSIFLILQMILSLIQ